MIEGRVRITYRELEASKKQVIDGAEQVLVATSGGRSGGPRSFPVLAPATTRAAEVARRAVALLGSGSSNSSNNSNTSMIRAGQARTGKVPVQGTSTENRRKIGRGRIHTPLATADISHGRNTQTVAGVETSRGRRYATRASLGPEDTRLVPTACTTPPGIPPTYVGRKAPSQQCTMLTPAQGVTCAA